MPPRVQRFFLRLLRYDYVLTFVPGKELNLADMLSRSPGPGDGTPVDTTDVDLHAVSMVSSLVSERTSGRLAHVDELRDLSTTSVVDALRAMFARYGLPLQLCTDNGPQLASHEFAQFAARYDFEHVTSSPRYPCSNGLAEKGVQVVKRILKKTTEANEDFWLGLLNYRASPLEDGRFPGELLQGRRLRTLLPDFTHHPAIQVKKHNQTIRNHRQLPPLEPDDVVRVRGKAWSPKATVIAQAGPRSFCVRTENKKTIRRNRRHLLATKENPSPEVSFSDTDDEQVSSTASSEAGRTDGAREQSPPPVALRRSQRQPRPPQRLAYDANFKQIGTR
ncbi:uncharacterized protein LOC125947152 [Dermacentor silvarum]|uniref:uncharacterized protein LOC125947152 n=1 Tax=Dermacentor silvarum TaxID=543639 RepID=UPI0021017F81|nr:uncharacterized protein LOC125947152 [Dermacentor silvarum]